MQMFEYIIVLISIVIGLALTHLMQGVAGLIQHPGRTRIWWVHLVWVAYMFLCTVFWWWVEFRLQNIETWTFPIYFFVICLAFYVYLICAVLFPKDLEGYADYKDYFLRRRKWFFGLLIGWLALDLVDVWIKGADHLPYFSTEYIVVGVILLLGYVAGLISRSERVQAVIAVATLANQISWVLRMFNTVA